MRPPPGAGAAVLALVVLLPAPALASGCGASALQTHARAALVTTSAVETAGEVVDAARDDALDRVEAEHPVDPEHDRAVRAEASRWRPVGQALDATREALGSWVESIELARIAGDGSLDLVDLLPMGARVLRLYDRVAALARELGARVPALPDGLSALLAAAGGAVPLQATAGGER
jgi:hypothetical protein